MRCPSGETRGTGSVRSRLSSTRAVAAAPPAAVRESRFVVGRESLDHPARLILVGEQSGSAAEHALQRAPDPPRAVEVKDVRELVRGDETQPAVVEQQAVVAGGRRDVDRDAARWKHRGEPVRRIDVVAQGEIHDTARRARLPGEEVVRPLRLACLQQRDGAIRGPEVDTEMGRVQGAPGTGGIDLGTRTAGEQQKKKNAERGSRNAEQQSEVRAAARPFPDVPRSAFRVPRYHGYLARWRRKFSIQRAIPRAYRWRPSSLASIASCSGSMMNSPSVSAAGIQVGRTSA